MGQTSQYCRPESKDTNHKSLASMGNCADQRREPNLLQGTRQRREIDPDIKRTLSLGWRRYLGIVLGNLRDGTPGPRTVPIGDLLVRVVASIGSHVSALAGVVRGIRSHLCCLFAFGVGKNKNESNINFNCRSVGEWDRNERKYCKTKIPCALSF